MKNKSKISLLDLAFILVCLMVCVVTLALIFWGKPKPPVVTATVTSKPVMTATATVVPTFTKTVKPTNTTTPVVPSVTPTATTVVNTNTPVPTIMPTPTRTLIPQKEIGGKMVKGEASKR